jgi:hypothetical protein
MSLAVAVVDALGRSADRLDARRWRRRGGRSPGAVAKTWATTKVLASLPITPPVTLLIGWRAAANHLRAKQTMASLPDLVAAVCRGEETPPGFGRLRRLDATQPWLITSDLHRCVAGRLDLVGQQDDRELYAAMLDWYAERGFGLIENGDVEDFWMVGGSVWGSVYDVLRLVGAALVGRSGDSLRQATYVAHLERIVANNRPIYDRLGRRFGRAGRYHRTIGNHDDAYEDDRLAARLADLTGGATMSSWLALDGPGGTEAVLCHGHVADGWNAPGRATLGKLSSWVADMIRDAPVPLTPDDLPPPRVTRQLLSGRRRNGLLRVNPRFGASSSYDSLDEELLFDALGGAANVGPWVIMGHTHFPVVEPASDTGARWWRYINSGHGLGAGVITGVEWPGADSSDGGGAPRPRLVAWCWGDHPDWIDLVSGGGPTTFHDGRPVVRVELVASRNGELLVPVRDTPTSTSRAELGVS